jgi:hypothetical protein
MEHGDSAGVLAVSVGDEEVARVVIAFEVGERAAVG